jgi:hypothetical protein
MSGGAPPGYLGSAAAVRLIQRPQQEVAAPKTGARKPQKPTGIRFCCWLVLGQSLTAKREEERSPSVQAQLWAARVGLGNKLAALVACMHPP